MQKKWYGDSFHLGVLGGGQLGRMLIQSAINFDIKIHCLDPDEQAPCNELASTFTIGSLTDFDEVYRFGQDKDLITVEIENISIEALERLESEGKKIFPQPRVLKIIRDKGLQKQFYLENQIPTAPFDLIENREELAKYTTKLPFMQKMRTGGYDGKGVKPIRNESDFTGAFEQASVIESFVDFEKELSVIVARNEAGETKAFPLVECEFSAEANLVEFLFSPADCSDQLAETAEKIAIEIITKLDMVGILAVEFFLTKSGELLVNEIAPRPHNSGHHSIECNVTSQFEQHLRSILNLPLGDTRLIQPGVMINLLGESGFEGLVVYEGLEEALAYAGVKPHFYGKRYTKGFRKMGHVTIVDPNLEQAKIKGRKIQEILKVKA